MKYFFDYVVTVPTPFYDELEELKAQGEKLKWKEVGFPELFQLSVVERKKAPDIARLYDVKVETVNRKRNRLGISTFTTELYNDWNVQEIAATVENDILVFDENNEKILEELVPEEDKERTILFIKNLIQHGLLNK